MSLVQRLIILVLLSALGSLAWAASNETAPVNFVGMKPCRIADTRGVDGFTLQAGPPALIANASRTFQVTGTVPGLPAQCGIPTSAVAVSINITVTGFSSGGDLRIYPAGATLPLASIINFQQENVANATNLGLGPVGSEKGFTVRADAASTQFIADINGYFVPRHLTYLESGQTEKGTYMIAFEATAAGQWAASHESFSVPILGALHYVTMPQGSTPTSECPGSAANPTAAVGHMCLYEATSALRDSGSFTAWNPGYSSAYGTFGAAMQFHATGAGLAWSQGTWAATAP